jgi:hypothetical protein
MLTRLIWLPLEFSPTDDTGISLVGRASVFVFHVDLVFGAGFRCRGGDNFPSKRAPAAALPPVQA